MIPSPTAPWSKPSSRPPPTTSAWSAAPTPIRRSRRTTDAPPGIDPATSLHLGLFADTLIGIAELSFGYPTAADAYIGLMILAPAARGQGAGAALLRYLEAIARARGATHLYLGVLAANPRGQAFWNREGFTVILADRPVTIGHKTQLAHRLGKPL